MDEMERNVEARAEQLRREFLACRKTVRLVQADSDGQAPALDGLPYQRRMTGARRRLGATKNRLRRSRKWRANG